VLAPRTRQLCIKTSKLSGNTALYGIGEGETDVH